MITNEEIDYYGMLENNRRERRHAIAQTLLSKSFPWSDIPRIGQAISDWVEGDSKPMPKQTSGKRRGRPPLAKKAKKAKAGKRKYTKKSTFWKKRGDRSLPE